MKLRRIQTGNTGEKLSDINSPMVVLAPRGPKTTMESWYQNTYIQTTI